MAFGGTKEKNKTLQLQENDLFCLLKNKQKPNKRNQNQTENQEMKVYKDLFACWNTTHYFCYVFFLQLTPYSQQKTVFPENTMFSRRKNLCWLQIVKTRLEIPSKSTSFQSKD